MRTLVGLVALLLIGQPAVAGCSFTITDVAFGNVDVTSGNNVDATATLSISCTGFILTTIRICPSIGAGSSGANSSARQMQGSSTTLNYQLFQDAARTTVWGSWTWGFAGTPPTIDLSTGLGGSASTTATLYGRIFSNQNTAGVGGYSSNFTTSQTNFIYQAGLLGLVGTCPSLSAPTTANPTFNVTATVLDKCSVSAQSINFGSAGVLVANVDATGQVLVTCTNGTGYTISLNGGNANAAPGSRKMANGAATVTYGLYRDSARSQVWGSTVGTDTMASTGTGSQQVLTVYGRVPPQNTPSPGAYSDTIVVTVSY